MPRRFRPSVLALEDRWTPAAGDLDLTFGSGGQVPTAVTGPTTLAYQPDGAVLVVGSGSSAAPDQSGFVIERLTPGGAVDTGFGTNGLARIPSPGVLAGSAVATVLPDGRILVAGVEQSPNNKAVSVFRLTADGQVDPTFGAGRLQVAPDGYSSFVSRLTGVTALPDGRVVVAGQIGVDGYDSSTGRPVPYTNYVPFAGRLTAAGQPDTGFGPAGVPDLGNLAGSVTGLAALPDGRVVLAGEFAQPTSPGRFAGPYPLAAVRLTATGQFDTGFGSGGVLANPDPQATFSAVAARPDGTLLLAGTKPAGTIGSGAHFINIWGPEVVRVRADGSPDTSFAGGLVNVPSSTYPGVRFVSFTQDGGAIVGYQVAIYPPAGPITYGVTRLRPDGTLDANYGQAGTASVSGLQPATVAPNGQVLLTGTGDSAAVGRLTGDPRPATGTVLVGGFANGTAQPFGPTGPAGNPVDFYPGFAGTVRTAVADVTGDGVPDYVAGPGPGGGPNVVVVSGATGQKVANLDVFEGTFTGGVFVAAADLNGDGKAEVIVTPDEGGGPVVVVYDGAGLTAGRDNAAQLSRFLGIVDLDFRGGARPAVGDVNGDGTPDLIVAAGFGGGPRVAVFDGTRSTDPSRFDTESVPQKQVPSANGVVRFPTPPALISVPPKLRGDFFVFEPTLRNGVFVTAGDLTGDGVAEVIVGGGPGGGPRVMALDGRALTAGTQTAVANFFAGDADSRGGVRVAVATGTDGKLRLVTGSGDNEPARVRVYTAAAARAGTAPEQELAPFNGVTLTDGVYVG